MSTPKTDNCPFCGGDKHMVLPPNCTKTGDYNPGDNAQPIVRCMKCYAETMGSPWDYTKESAVTAWNTRTDLSQASVAAVLEAAKIDGSAGVRIQDVAQYLIDHMPAYNSEHPCWEALQDANDDGADEDDCIRAWLRSIAQIGAKP